MEKAKYIEVRGMRERERKKNKENKTFKKVRDGGKDKIK
jgi:hypothetical protein